MTVFKPDILLTTSMRDPQLFGEVFGSPSYWTWFVVSKLIDGIALTEPREIELFEQCTGRRYDKYNRSRVRTFILLIGRRGGKDRFLSGVGVWRAALCTDWSRYSSAGEGAVVVLLGADKKQAGILSKYCAGLLRVPLLAHEIVRQTNEVIEFRNGASLEIATNDHRLVRGRSAFAVLGSEVCHWKTDEFAASSDEEVVSAAEKSMAMTIDGGILMLGSSVHRKKGLMYKAYRESFANDDAEELVWFAPSRVMNPALEQDRVDRAMRKDPARARADYLNEWRDDVTDCYPHVVLEAATDWGVYERPYQQGFPYAASADNAEGVGQDSYALAIAYRDPQTKLTYVVGHREYKPNFVPSAVVAELAKWVKSYSITEVWGDRHAPGFHADLWNQNGVNFKIHKEDTSKNYITSLSHFLGGAVRLHDSNVARDQFVSLERHADGKVDHPRHGGAHDDVSCAIAGAVVAANRAGAAYWESGLFQDMQPNKTREQAAAEYQQSRLQMRLFEMSGRTLWPY